MRKPKVFSRSASPEETDSLTISEFADLFGLPASAILAAIEKNRSAIRKDFYTIPDLSRRWSCSRATVYNVLRESEFKLLDLSRKGKHKGHWNVPAAVVERIEQSRMHSLPDTIAA